MKIFLITLLTAPIFAQAPEISFDSTPNFLKLPDRMYMGEVARRRHQFEGVTCTSTRAPAIRTRPPERPAPSRTEARVFSNSIRPENTSAKSVRAPTDF